jgi:ubiquinone biosynthesis protein
MGLPVLTILGFAGYVVAFLNSVWIILGIWRSGKE